MRLRFTKMHGLGNDFVVIDAINQQVELTEKMVRHMADRHLGIGCDQILLIEAPRMPATDFHYRIINADGSEVEACGNGARCFARFVHDKGLSDKAEIPVGTNAGAIVLKNLDGDQVEVNMGIPVLEPSAIPFEASARALTYPLEVDDVTHEICAISMGNPHAVLLVPSVDETPVDRLGPLIEQHPRFPHRVNAGFMQVLDHRSIRLRVYERGTGETRACGTGACAAVVAGRLLGRLDPQVEVSLPGGELVVEWQGEGQPVLMRGTAQSVFEGTIEL